MTVAELIAKLQEMPQDMRVLTHGDDRVDFVDVVEVEVMVIQKNDFTDHLDFGKAKKMTAVVL